MNKITSVKIGSLTSLALLRKAGFTSLADTITHAQTDQRIVEAALSKDNTRTELAANIEAVAHAEKQCFKVSKQFDHVMAGVKEKFNKLDSKIQPFRSIKGTTDLMILNQYLPILTTKTEVLRVASLDQDGARAALLSPVVRHKIQLSPEALTRVNNDLNRHVLGGEYPDLQKAQADLSTLKQVGYDFLEEMTGTMNKLQTMQKNIVDPALLDVTD